MPAPPRSSPDRLHAVLWLAAALGLVWLVYALSPILAPFLLAAILAYICNPLVDRLQRARLPRLAGVLLVMLLLGALLAGLTLILVPLLMEEAGILFSRLPEGLALANERLSPWLQQTFGLKLAFDPDSLKTLAGENMNSLQAIAQKLYESLKIGGIALVGLAAMLLLAPVVMFYLLLDWPALLARIDNAIPRPWHAKASALFGEVNRVLSEFLRGQLLVMLILAAYYSIALVVAGLPSAMPVGLLTGLMIFIPYLGYATGLVLALLVAVLQFQGWSPVVAVLVVYGIGQILEGFILTPYLVGERIGLHPLAVIFALMAFGQIFGFFGVLLALPVSAALLVGLREVRRLYLASRYYRGSEP
ncbi:MAG TPA: AI-2E family transporter [Rhodocyclaceae bacterium]|nr:AI-2E family transporter [Rhodocyclaceae bacterium]